MKELILELIYAYSMINGVDPVLAASVAKVESNLNTEVVGEVGELGIYQLRPRYFSPSCKGKRTDFVVEVVPKAASAKNKKAGVMKIGEMTINDKTVVLQRRALCGLELADVETNIRAGIKRLAYLEKQCSHKGKVDFVLCHNVGIQGASRIVHADRTQYVRRVAEQYATFQREGLYKNKFSHVAKAP